MNEYQLPVSEKKLFILIVKKETQVVKRTSKIKTEPERLLL